MEFGPPPTPDAVNAAVIPAKDGIQAFLILDPGLRRGDGASDDSLTRLQEIYRHSLWTLTTCRARGFPRRTKFGPIISRKPSERLSTGTTTVGEKQPAPQASLQIHESVLYIVEPVVKKDSTEMP